MIYCFNIGIPVYVHTHTHLFFPFSGQPCISDNEDMREVDLPEGEADTGCPPPALPENGFIWVSILTVTFGLRFKRRTWNVWVFFSLELLFSYFKNMLSQKYKEISKKCWNTLLSWCPWRYLHACLLVREEPGDVVCTTQVIRRR